MIIPALITAGILGGVYYFGREPESIPRPPDVLKPTPEIPTNQIPTQLQTRMGILNSQLPTNLQIPPAQWGNPAAWTNLYTTLTSGGPLLPQAPAPPPTAAPEILAILNALNALPRPQPTPLPFPPTPSGPVPIPPQLEAELRSVISALPPPFNTAFPIPPPSLPLQTPVIDPAQLILLATQIEVALGQAHPGARNLRSIAARLGGAPTAGTAPMPPMGPMMGPVMGPAPTGLPGELRTLGGILPVAQDAAQTYRDILALRDQFSGVPGAPYPYDAMGAYARRRYRRVFG